MDPRYPVGKFEWKGSLSDAERKLAIDQIAATPARMREAARGLNASQLDTPYRDGGWTVRQVVHHVPDSHLNAYVRMKLALTEDSPMIKPYEEARWAELADTARTPVEVSLTLLDSLHERWLTLIRAMKPGDFARTFVHPEHKATLTLDWLVALYSWHGRHHAAHITTLREKMGWK